MNVHINTYNFSFVLKLSLFAESLNEMLQYEMGCRLLGFLEVDDIKLAFCSFIYVLAYSGYNRVYF